MKLIWKITTAAVAMMVTAASSLKADNPVKQPFWPETTAIGSGFVINIGLTELFKHTVTEMRPDGNGKHSFPSRHSSWMAGAAFGVSELLYRHSPWWVLGAHVLTDVVGLQRTFSSRHYPKDVLGAYVIAAGSMQTGKFISSWVFPDNVVSNQVRYDNEWRPAVAVHTRALFPSGTLKKDITLGTGISSAVDFRLPTSDHAGLVAEVEVGSLPFYIHDKYAGMLKNVGLSAGIAGFTSLSKSWALEATAKAGVIKNFSTGQWPDRSWSLGCGIDCGISYALTSSLKIGGYGGYSVRTLSRGLSIWSLGFSTSAMF